MSQGVASTEASVRQGQKETAQYMAEQIVRVFNEHDQRNRANAIEACKEVDALYFQHVDQENIRLGATAFVDALWAKDDVEFHHLRGGELDQDSLASADWSPVRQKFRERAAALGIDQEFAIQKTKAWRRHKTGGDYLTPFQRAQVLELRAALRDSEYPHKPKYGQDGPGPEAIRYALCVELHDFHTPDHWQQAKQVMVPYFMKVLKENTNDDE